MPLRPQHLLEESDILLVKSIAKKVVRSIGFSGHLDDLIQEGYIALIGVKERYKAQINCSFSTYASHRIKGAMMDFLRSQDFVSRDARKLLKDVARVKTQLEHREKCKPSMQAISKELNIEVETLSNALLSIPEQVVSHSQFDADILADLSQSEQHQHIDNSEVFVVQQQIKAKMSILDAREKRILIDKYWNDATYKNIARKLKISPTMCVQLHDRSIIKMRKGLAL